MNTPAALIHIIDDDVSFRTAIGRLLRASGYQVALYHSGEQFLDVSLDDVPGCILLDMRMSGLSGLQLQDRLKQVDSILPILFLTGHGDIPTSVKAIKAGAEDFLSKPVSKDTLLEAIERAIERYREFASQGLVPKPGVAVFTDEMASQKNQHVRLSYAEALVANHAHGQWQEALGEFQILAGEHVEYSPEDIDRLRVQAQGEGADGAAVAAIDLLAKSAVPGVVDAKCKSSIVSATTALDSVAITDLKQVFH